MVDPSIGVAIFILGLCLVRFVGIGPSNATIGWVMMVFGFVFTVVVYDSMHSTWAYWQSTYDRGWYSTVEGVVKDFTPEPYEGHAKECFRVDKTNFCYSYFMDQAGFHQSASHGGPIREGLPVRIAYTNNHQILRLDVEKSRLVPEAQREALAKSKELEWQREMWNDVRVQRTFLGFLLALVIITFFYNFSWRRQLFFWLRRKPPFSSPLELGFRAFLLFSLIGDLIYFLHAFGERNRSARDLEVICLIALVWLAVFSVLESLSYWRWRTEIANA